MTLEGPQEGFNNLSEQFAPLLSHSHSTALLPDVNEEPAVLQLCLLTLVLALGINGKSLAPSFLHPSFRYL